MGKSVRLRYLPSNEVSITYNRKYCPYTNIDGKKLANNEYPHLLVIGGMNDPRVAYFEPLRLVAKMRNEMDRFRTSNCSEPSQEERTILLQLEDCGHLGATGQYSRFEKLALQYAYLISILGAPEKPLQSNEALSKVNHGNLSQNGIDEPKATNPSRKKHKEIVERAKLRFEKARLLKWINGLF
jgi:Prolyl oligopeptidase family